MYVNFQDLCEVKDEDNVVLKDNVDSADIKSNDNIINNLLGDIFYRKHNAKNEKPELKDYKLSSVELGELIFKEVAEHFNIKPMNNCLFRIFDILVAKDSFNDPYKVKFSYTYTMFEMGSK